MDPKFKVVVLISGRGSNLRSLLQNADHYQVVAVISNNSDAGGLSIAGDAGIDTVAFGRCGAASLDDQKKQIYRKVQQLLPDLVVLAGFMLILDPDFVEAYEGKIVNIHPSLLPEFKGLNTHRRALTVYHDNNLQNLSHGCTVHYVDNGVDTGPIIAQARCRIYKTDTEDILSARVLEMEHRLFPWVVNAISKGDVSYQAGNVLMSLDARQEAATLGFLTSARGRKVIKVS